MKIALNHLVLSEGGFRASYIAASLVLVLSASADAGEWRIEPRADVEQSVTDNARSVAEGEEMDLITTATAGIAINGIGRRVQLNFDYNISQDNFWDNSELNGFRQNLLGVGNVEMVEDFVFVDTRASISQVSLARTGGASATDRTLGTNDQTTVVNFSMTPNFAHRYGDWADSDVIISYNETMFLDTDTGTANSQPDGSRSFSINTLVRSGPKFTKLKWELSGEKTFTNNDSDRDITELSGEYAWSRHVKLLGGFGSETIDNSGINADDSAEFFWRAGTTLTPGPRTSFTVEISNRFDDTTYSGNASYQVSSRTAITASYTVSVQNDREALTDNLNSLIVNEAGDLIDPNTGQPGSPNDSQFDFREQTTKREDFNIALNGTRGRNTFSIFGSYSNRTELPGDSSDTVVALGGNINRRIWPDLDGGISANVSATTEAVNGIEDITFNSSAFLSYRIQESFSGNLRYSYLRRDSDDNTDDLEENVISLSLSKTF